MKLLSVEVLLNNGEIFTFNIGVMDNVASIHRAYLDKSTKITNMEDLFKIANQKHFDAHTDRAKTIEEIIR